MNIPSVLHLTFLVSISFFLISCSSEEEGEIEVEKTNILPGFHDLNINFTQTDKELGVVSIQPNDLTCRANCTSNIADDVQLDLIATPISGARFIAWGGDCSGNNTCQVTMSSEHTVTATFSDEVESFPTEIPSYPLSIQMTKGGTIDISDGLLECISDCGFSFNKQEILTLKAIPDTGYVFIGWGGDCEDKSTCEVTMSSEHSVTASFSDEIESFPNEIPIYSLAMKMTTGGSIDISDGLLECISDCEFSFNKQETLILNAIPDEGYVFIGWGGDCEDKSTCEVTMSSEHSVTASFSDVIESFPNEIPIYPLVIQITKGGSIDISDGLLECISDCEFSFNKEETLTLKATPDEGYIFTGWGGDCEDKSTCEVTMSSEHSVTATFEEIPLITLSIGMYEGGSITITGDQGSCDIDCELSFIQDIELIINPTPDEGYIFIGWSGDCSDNSTCLLTMSTDKSITAIFEEALSAVASNTITITEPHGENQTDYPIQIGRPFIKGEIANYPQVMYSGVAIPTQADVKQRHDDGSVKHAILSFILPSLNANSSQTFSFVNKVTSDNTPLTKTEILADTTFNADMSFTFTETSTVSARDMITSDNFEYWLKGSVATSIIISDNSVERIYDVGNDTYRSVRPIFHVTFWPTIDKYSVRYIAEAINTEALQNQVYDIGLSIGGASSFYQKDDVPHQAKSRWTQKKWSGTQLKTLSINHNLAYLASTKSIPNFDTSRQPSESSITSYWNSWAAQATDIYEKGLWQTVMSTTGGRRDIGVYPDWSVQWLYTGDWRFFEISMKQADLAASWPMHLREGDSGRHFDFSNTVDALGKILSIAPSARPTHWIARPEWHEVNTNDKVFYVGDSTGTNWQPDTSHHPDVSSPQYLLTGDYFYLEEMLFSSAFVTSNNNAKGFTTTLGRGPTGSEGALYSGQTRAQAWALRTRVHTYDILPDTLPEKAYFHQLNKNAISMFEGLYSLPLSNIDNQDLYDFAANTIHTAVFTLTNGASPYGNWERGLAAYVKSSWFDASVVHRAMAPWQQNFVIVALGRAKDVGYGTDALLGYAGLQLLGPFSDVNLPHHMIFAYVTPCVDLDFNWFTSWSDVYAGYNIDYVESMSTYSITNNDAQNGTPSVTMGAAAYLSGHHNHPELWKYILDNVANKDIYNDDPKWAILPRTD